MTANKTETAAPDNFFAPLGNTKPYVKIALEGFAGCGKTYTMAQIAAGLHARIGSKKPIVFFDTERSAKFLVRFFAERGIEVLLKESRSMADLKETMRRCREGLSDVLLIDSISHVWENFVDAYKAKTKKTRIEFQDWGILKPTWKAEFSEPFVTDPYHTLMTGRAAYEYESEMNQETQKREIFKAGIKMKVEGETAYEPDILILMSRFEEVLGDKKEVWREATVIKDRSTLIDGKTFDNPTYEDLAPAVEFILENPADRATTAERDAAALFSTEEDKRAFFKRRDIVLEKIEAYLTECFPGQSAEAKKTKVLAFKECLGSTSWTEIQGMHPEKLEAGLEAMHAWVQKKNAAAQSEVAS